MFAPKINRDSAWLGLMAILWFGLLTASCEPSRARIVREASKLAPGVNHSEIPVTPLSSSVFSEGDDFAWPWKTLSVGDKVVIADRPWIEGAIHIVAAADGTPLATFGRRGEGPGEYRTYPDLIRSLDCDTQEFWTFDRSLRRLTRIDLSEPMLDGFDRRVIVRVPITESMTHAGFLSDSLVVFTGGIEDGRVALWDRASDSVTVMGPLPPSEPEIPSLVVQDAYKGPLAVRPDGEAFAVSAQRGTRLDLFSTAGGWVGVANVPFQWEPDYNMKANGDYLYAEEGLRNRSGYVDLAATQDRVFALFSGRSEFWHRGDMDLAEYIHEFDWEGQFIRAYQLDRAVEHIEVDLERNRILATVPDPEPMVVSFLLPGQESSISMRGSSEESESDIR